MLVERSMKDRDGAIEEKKATTGPSEMPVRAEDQASTSGTVFQSDEVADTHQTNKSLSIVVPFIGFQFVAHERQ